MNIAAYALIETAVQLIQVQANLDVTAGNLDKSYEILRNEVLLW